MKKQNNILTYIAKITYSVAFAVSCYACADDDIIKNNYIEEGIPVEISLNFASPEMTSISTRGLDDDQEKQVNNLYILIFNEAGTRKEGGGLYLNTTANNGEVTLNTTSGKSLIYGIANAKTNQHEDLVGRLDELSNIDQLNGCIIETQLQNDLIEVDRTSPNLVMSGAYINQKYINAGKPAGYCEINPEALTLAGGKLELIHLDSRIQFNIHTGSKVTKIEPEEWQVCNVPKQSFLIEQEETNAGGVLQKYYANSHVYNNQTIHTETDTKNELKKMHTFRFYQFENFKKAKGEFEANDREKEIKEEQVDGTFKNTGTFANVEPCATYVQFKVYMELTIHDEGTQKEIQRIADAKFTILLGGKNPGDTKYDFRNFNTWRNTRYTYDVTINDVDDIVTEVTVEDQEPRPGIEGDVIDAQDEIRVLDSHYNCFNVAFTADQVKEMSILVHTPFDEVIYQSKDENGKGTLRPTGNRDYKWIKFKYVNPQDNGFQKMLANYTDPDKVSQADDDEANGRLDIYGLREDVIKRAGGNTSAVINYTVFVDEYFYTDKPCDNAKWSDDPRTYWKYFVNKDDRYIMLLYTPQKSADQESSYSKARYFIKQKSIQTYYSTTNLTSDGTALGMEHVNEHYANVTEEPSRKNRKTEYDDMKVFDKDNGYLNCYNFFNSFYWDGKKWDTFVRNRITTENLNNNTFEERINTVHSMCLSRNRDKNGDGVIDANEIEWYSPTYKQISGMYLGAKSLPSPIFTPVSGNDTSIKYDDLHYHFMTSDGDKIWAQEGCSNSGIVKDAYQIRCVRNLGISAEESLEKVPKQPYSSSKENDHYVFDMTRMDENNLRLTKATTLGYHSNFRDSRNRPYKKIELAKDFFKEKKIEPGQYTWEVYNTTINGKDLCEDYAETGDSIRGKGAWRTPNQRELLVIYNTIGFTEMSIVIGDVNYGMYSCTRWEYLGEDKDVAGNFYRIFAINPGGRNMYLDNVHKMSDIGSILRCVRDID